MKLYQDAPRRSMAAGSGAGQAAMLARALSKPALPFD
jgi:hypothetical protein